MRGPRRIPRHRRPLRTGYPPAPVVRTRLLPRGPPAIIPPFWLFSILLLLRLCAGCWHRCSRCPPQHSRRPTGPTALPPGSGRELPETDCTARRWKPGEGRRCCRARFGWQKTATASPDRDGGPAPPGRKSRCPPVGPTGTGRPSETAVAPSWRWCVFRPPPPQRVSVVSRGIRRLRLRSGCRRRVLSSTRRGSSRFRSPPAPATSRGSRAWRIGGWPGACTGPPSGRW
mmetsp:Transcript_27992/g.59968  ORF Transcript_27992/g.59968 Transcript_27992/m.59968 type:complete len:229 (-) Transcript_27992:340-1026(-)